MTEMLELRNNAADLPVGNESVNDSVFEYQLLRGHARTDGSWKSTEELQEEYIRLTDTLVYKMTDGVEVVDHETGERSTRTPDYVVWLDKSARPLAWLTKRLWPLLAEDKDGNVPKMPDFRFVNVDREQWIGTIDPEGIGETSVDNVDPQIIRSLRSIFLQDPKDRPDKIDESIDEAPTELDGKTVLIVDEVHASGRTLAIATNFFRRAFPESDIASCHWMGGVTMMGSATGNADLPVWYRDDSSLGRGIANRDVSVSQKSLNRTQRLGAWFLSTRLRNPDRTSELLRKELRQLSEDAKNGKVLIIPSMQRSTPDVIERATRLNNMTLGEYKAARQKSHKA